MGKLKPVLFGAVLGAGIACVALQFHLVRSHEGFRLVPRTPQPSIGLAYADVREWGAEEWADRPELARALVAHGSTDLVATSVSEGLMESISSEGSAMNQLRGLMNDAGEGFPDNSILEDSGGLNIPKDRDDEDAASDLFSIPFQQDARRPSGNGVASVDSDAELRQPAVIARRNLPSIDDIMGAGSSSMPDLQRPNQNLNTVPDPRIRMNEPSSQDSGFSIADDNELTDDLLFGDDSGTSDQADETSDEGFGVFSDITAEVQQRSGNVIREARTKIADEMTEAAEEASGTMDRYLRGRVENVMPDSMSSMFQDDFNARQPTTTEGDGQASSPLDAIRNGLDPFIR